jgi:hypothetical protein
METALHGIDLAAEMAAARQRRMEQTARALRDARVLAVRAAARPGATREEVQEMAHSFYPRLTPEQLEEVTSLVWESQRGFGSTRLVVDDAGDAEGGLDDDSAAEL